MLNGLRIAMGGNALDRYRYLWMMIEGGLLGIALLFWVSVGLGVSAFSPETWGSWACEYPARGWAAVMGTSAALTITGLMRPVTARRVAFGAAVQAVQFMALAYSATFTGGQFVIGVYSSVLFAPLHIVLMVQALRYDR
jgi:hypothetical protein